MHANDDPQYKHLSLRGMNKEPYGIFYQVRLSQRLGRKTIGVGSDKLAAMNAAKAINDQLEQWIINSQTIDLDTLKDIAKRFVGNSERQALKVVEKDDLQNLWKSYVDFHVTLGCWEETYLLTHIQSVTSLVNKCPHQRIELKSQIVQWFFNDKNRSAKTSKARFKLVVAAIDWASKQGLIPRNWGIEYRDLLSSISVKVAKSKNLSVDDESIDIFSVKEVYQILEALKNETYSRFSGKHFQYYKFVYFLWLTGCRPSEAVALKWENVDLKNNKIVFKEGEVLASGKKIQKLGTKTVMQRKFPINEELKNLLTTIYHNEGYVFTGQNGQQISHQALRRMWINLLKSMGLKHRNLYQLRHTMISYHANNDYPIHKLAELVGNSEKIIKEHYLKLDIERINLPDVIR